MKVLAGKACFEVIGLILAGMAVVSGLIRAAAAGVAVVMSIIRKRRTLDENLLKQACIRIYTGSGGKNHSLPAYRQQGAAA